MTVFQIGKREKEIKDLYHRLDNVERALRLQELTPQERTEREKEVDLIKTILKKNEEQLKQLQKENYRTGVLATALIFICFLVYGMYAMFQNKHSN